MDNDCALLRMFQTHAWAFGSKETTVKYKKWHKVGSTLKIIRFCFSENTEFYAFLENLHLFGCAFFYAFLRMDYRAAKRYIVSRLRTELSDKLYYHGLHHTLDVLRVVSELCRVERVNRRDATLAKTAALFHDAGFMYNKHAGHEQEGCRLVHDTLGGFGYSAADIEVICGMIMATKIPQTPKNLLERILCDADLDYLGRDDFFPIGDSLFAEMQAYHLIEGRLAWNRLQVSFLEAHRYHTTTSKNHREPAKQKNLQAVHVLLNDQ